MPATAEHSLARTLRQDRKHGSSELARYALAGLAELAMDTDASNVADLRSSLIAVADQLCAARPSMATIENQIVAWKATVHDSSEGDLARFRLLAKKAGEKLVEQSVQATRKAARNAARKLGTDHVVMTASLSSTVLLVYEYLAPRIAAIVTESRPPGEGRELATRLSKLGIRTDFITDAQMGRFVRAATAIVVGADTVAADGSIVNKSGTYLLALAAREHGVPFLVCHESFKNSSLPPEEIQMERYAPEEYDAPSLPHVTAHNFYFETVPAALVSAWINEHGVFADFTEASNSKGKDAP